MRAAVVIVGHYRSEDSLWIEAEVRCGLVHKATLTGPVLNNANTRQEEGNSLRGSCGLSTATPLCRPPSWTNARAVCFPDIKRQPWRLKGRYPSSENRSVANRGKAMSGDCSCARPSGLVARRDHHYGPAGDCCCARSCPGLDELQHHVCRHERLKCVLLGLQLSRPAR